MTPLDVLELRRRVVVDEDMDAFADLFAADGVIEIPFVVEGVPARLAGRETIREFATRARDLPVRVTDLRTVAAHQTLDPEVVVVEIVTVGEVIATGETFEVPGIQVFRIRDEKIVLFRDYFGGQSTPDVTTVS
jgi:ketosteroid isomerase-like protein